MSPTVAVIGGGIFGVTAAVHAARAGYEVHLFEAKSDLLQAASGINQYRLHRGYHYPRSSETAKSAIAAELSFRSEYEESIISNGRHLYAVAREGSAVNGEQFLSFCDAHDLFYKVIESDIVNRDKIQLLIEADESRFDPGILRTVARRHLVESGVAIHLNTTPDANLLSGFDTVVAATYAATNDVGAMLGMPTREFQFEICEKPVVTLPADFGQTDLVVMDGPFMCVDPLGTSTKYLLGNVVHAIHATNIGLTPEIPPNIQPLLNSGIVTNPPVTRFDAFIESGSQYIPALADAEHIGSMFTVRTVMPRLESTDARPTLVEPLGDRYIRIFSGKIGNCVEAAKSTVELLRARMPLRTHAVA